MNLRKLVRLFPALAALAPLGVAAPADFGRFGATLDEAKRTQFFTWFHLEQTAADGSKICFQPSGAKFHDLVKVTVDAPGGAIRGMTVAVKRSFIDGADSKFARDIAKSFLNLAAYGDGPENSDLTELINQIWNSPSGGRTGIIRSDAPQPKLPAQATLAYRVFLGQERSWSDKVAYLQMLTLENRTDAGEGWLIMRAERISPRCCAPRR